MMTDKKKYSYNYLISKGLTPVQAAGIVGNLQQESNFDTEVLGFDGTGSVGIAQWLGDRKTNLQNFAKQNKKEYSDLDLQLDFILHELNTTEKKAFEELKKAKTVEEATEIFANKYERPHKDFVHMNKRIKYAKELETGEVQPQKSNYTEINTNLPEITGMAFAEEEEQEQPQTSEKDKRAQKANELSFVSDYNKLQPTVEAPQPFQIQQQQLVEGVEYQPIQEFQAGGTWKEQQEIMRQEKLKQLALLKDAPKPQYNDKKDTVKKETNQVAVDNTRVVKNNDASKASRFARNKTDKEIAEEREARIKAQAEANAKDFDWNNWRQSLADRSQATGDVFRVSNEPNFFDDYLNPAVMIGSMADNLGQSPLQAQQTDSYMPYVTSVGTPLLLGRAIGSGSINPVSKNFWTKSVSNKTFVNNLANPLAGTGDLVNNLGNKYLPNAHKLNPYAFKPKSEMGYRMLGKEGFDDAIETGVLRAKPAPSQPTTGGISLARNTNRNPNTGKMQGALDRPYFADGMIDERYAADYMAAVNKAENNLVPIPTHKGIAPLEAGTIPLENATLYQKDWLKGYKQIEVPKSNFKSEIDWAKWNKEIPENKALMQEYNAIEQQAKADGSWMENKNLFKKEIEETQKIYDDLSIKHKELSSLTEYNPAVPHTERLKYFDELDKLNPIIGDIHDELSFYKNVGFTPEQFVQINSKNFKNAFPDGFRRIYRGVQKFDADNIAKGSYRGDEASNILFGTDKVTHGQKYAKNGASGRNLDDYFDAINQPEFLSPESKFALKAAQIPEDLLLNPGVLDLAYGKNYPIKIIDAKGARWNELENYGTTDNIATMMKNGEISEPIVQMPNIHDGSNYFGGYKESTNTMIDPKRVQMKSLRYNNGMFDMTNPNIYKTLVPGAIATGATTQAPEFQNGGEIVKDNNGYWNKNNWGKTVEISSPYIDMTNVPFPVLGTSKETGEQKLMSPNSKHFFKNTQNVIEQNVFQAGGTNIEVDRGDGKVEQIDTLSQEYRDLYNQGLIGNYTADGIDLGMLEGVELTATQRPVKNYPNFKNLKVKEETFEQVKDSFEKNREMFIPVSEIVSEKTEVEPIEEYKQKFNSKLLDDVSYTDYKKLPTDIKQQIKEGVAKESGYYLEKPQTKEQIISTQRMLSNLGYDLGNYGKNKDGVDGIIGQKTLKALDQYNQNQSNISDEFVQEKLKEREKIKFKDFSPQPPKNFQALQSDEDIKDYQNIYVNKGYFKNKQEDFDLRPQAKNLKKSKKVFSTDFHKTYEKEDSCYGDECASFVTLDLLNNLKSFYGESRGAKMFEENQVRGDAWNMNSKIKKAGGETVYNVFDSKPDNVDNIKQFTKEKINNAPPIDKKDVKKGDVVHMFYSNSNNFDKAYKEGDDIFSTHVGIIKEDDKGNLVVEHNVSGKIYHNKLEDFSKNKYSKAGKSQIAITGVSRPKYNLGDTKEEVVEYVETSSPNQFNVDYITNRNSPFFKETLPQAQETLATNKDKIIKDIPISSQEFDNLEKAVVSIMWKESYGNEYVDRPKFDKSNPEPYLKKNIAPILENFGRESSKGLTQLKPNKNFNEKIRNNIIKNSSDLYDPNKSAIISMYSLSSKYLYLRDLALSKNIPVTKDELTKLAILSWNEPINKVGETLEKYGNFDKAWAAYNKNEKHNYTAALEVYDNAFKPRINNK